MTTRFWQNHYLSTGLWWVFLFLFFNDYFPHSGGWSSTAPKDIIMDIELIALIILTFIRGYNYRKFKKG